MKSLLTAIVLLVSFQLSAQNTVTSEKYKIAFESSELLKQYETEAETVLGYENKNYAVDIEIFAINEQPKAFVESQKSGAIQTAISLGLDDAILGGEIPQIPGAYYAIAFENYDGERNPVFVIAAINNKLGIAYEATVYCYSKDLGEGQKIAESFRLIE